MAVQVNPITQSLPATTAIQDPAVRRFAQAVDDALRALRSEEGAVESLKKAADAMNGAIAGGTPPSIAQWLFSSELYQKLTTEIARVDTQAKQDVLDEALARSQAIQQIQAALAEIESTPAYDPATTYQIGDLVTYDNKLYRAKAETTGNLPTNTTYWDKVGDYATLGDVVAAHTLQLSEIESDITDIGGDLAAEITARDTLAAQLRGTYTGTDVAMVSQGLLYSERQARLNADDVTVSNLSALRAQVGVTEAGALTDGFILNEQTIRNTNDLAIVNAVNTALAQITGVSTSISQSGENLIANWTTAQAYKWSQIESEVLTSGGQTIRAALAQESNTRSTLAGQVSSTWMVRAQIDSGTGKPYIAGIALGAEGQNGGATSEFIVQADKFVMTMPGYGNHVPFAIGPSGAEFTGLTSWGNVTGSGKPLDNSGRIIDGDRFTNPNPADFPPGETFYFKQSTSVGVTGAGTYGVLRTVRPYGTGTDLSGGGVFQWFEAEQLVWARKSTSATAWSSWQRVPNETITTSNVTTYIANAAIGNAQIGGNLWSTNWNYAGGTGWLLDRSGNFYGNNVYARGDIEASSLKADTLMVQTAHVAGNAITVPIAASGTTSCQTAAADFGGSPVAVTFTGGAFVSTTDSNVTTGTVSAYLKRNGVVINALRCFTATVVNTDSGFFGSAAFTFIDHPGAGTHYYSVEVFKSAGLAATTLSQQRCSVLAIGVKR